MALTIYEAIITYLNLQPPSNIICTSTSATGFIFSFILPAYADYCEYTTDEGSTYLTCQSGVKITKQSNGQDFVPNDTYYFRFRSVENDCDDRWAWSDAYEVMAVADTEPGIKALLISPQDNGAYFRGYVTDDGGSVLGCEVWAVIDSEETEHLTGKHTGYYVKIFNQLSEGRHTYQFAIKNLWGTTYTEEKSFVFSKGNVRQEVWLGV
ncbi:MAG: hypothetical protein GYA14_11495 [Ignavibacteria bacterium]|nr:hypothetical protein [Ignavibacteria bacterium]